MTTRPSRILKVLSPICCKFAVECDWNSKVCQISTKFGFLLGKFCWKNIDFWKSFMETKHGIKCALNDILTLKSLFHFYWEVSRKKFKTFKFRTFMKKEYFWKIKRTVFNFLKNIFYKIEGRKQSRWLPRQSFGPKFCVVWPRKMPASGWGSLWASSSFVSWFSTFVFRNVPGTVSKCVCICWFERNSSNLVRAPKMRDSVLLNSWDSFLLTLPSISSETCVI